jgi:hypothetical protein
MIKSFINKHFPLALRSDRERTEQLIRLAGRANDFDIQKMFDDCEVNADTGKQFFDLMHNEYGKLLLSSYFERDMAVYRKTISEVIMQLSFKCEAHYWTVTS